MSEEHQTPYQRWYAVNKGRYNSARRRKYWTDAEYRKKVQNQAAESMRKYRAKQDAGDTE